MALGALDHATKAIRSELEASQARVKQARNHKPKLQDAGGAPQDWQRPTVLTNLEVTPPYSSMGKWACNLHHFVQSTVSPCRLHSACHAIVVRTALSTGMCVLQLCAVREGA